MAGARLYKDGVYNLWVSPYAQGGVKQMTVSMVLPQGSASGIKFWHNGSAAAVTATPTAEGETAYWTVFDLHSKGELTLSIHHSLWEQAKARGPIKVVLLGGGTGIGWTERDEIIWDEIKVDLTK